VSLAGTQWQLVSIRSMDDAQGTTHVAPPERLTAHFDAGSRVSFQLDCNRGTATWKATPAVNPAAGSIEFGPVAATRALCPRPHLDERVARDLAFVRGYRIKEGYPYLTLLADGGIYEWRPAKP
jgi:heat shock protein HslJ